MLACARNSVWGRLARSVLAEHDTMPHGIFNFVAWALALWAVINKNARVPRLWNAVGLYHSGRICSHCYAMLFRWIYAVWACNIVLRAVVDIYSIHSNVLYGIVLKGIPWAVSKGSTVSGWAWNIVICYLYIITLVESKTIFILVINTVLLCNENIWFDTAILSVIKCDSGSVALDSIFEDLSPCHSEIIVRDNTVVLDLIPCQAYAACNAIFVITAYRDSVRWNNRVCVVLKAVNCFLHRLHHRGIEIVVRQAGHCLELYTACAVCDSVICYGTILIIVHYHCHIVEVLKNVALNKDICIIDTQSGGMRTKASANAWEKIIPYDHIFAWCIVKRRIACKNSAVVHAIKLNGFFFPVASISCKSTAL